MDIAALSVTMANQQIPSDASIAVMKNAMKVIETQGVQLQEMLDQSAPTAPHPSLGNRVDISL
ncbi:hypothetical protein GCM10008934_35960 [Virgibacillus salarius]